MNKPKELGGKIMTTPFKILMIFAGIAAVLMLKRFIFGLGSVTNLNDGYPWGLWITYDVVTGTAIACGGYSMAMLVYMLNGGKYHPLVRSALMAGMFGYTLAGVSIYLDVGRWWQLHNIFLPWYANTNSVMFEVAVCVASYVAVMWIEFSPAFLEKLNKTNALRKLKKVMFIFIALGILLPTMHQSSLGTMMIMAGSKLSPLWQTPWLPLLFLMSAISMGFAIVVFESLFVSTTMNRPFETPLLSKIGKIIAYLIVAYLAIRLTDLIWRGTLGSVLNCDLKSFMFLFENALYIYPVVILTSSKKRQSRQFLFLSASSMVFAGVIYRFNTYLIGFDPGGGYHYFPAVQEILITVGIISMEIILYLIFIKRLPVLPEVKTAT
ncbi:MAG: Ni/Fe-hydrogenase cytochrome b subunit [Calditrichaeota bacterium]|nr:MAG: Ni/Fe-hydrogenase cytochrome b subunit [Calditrichota bacterium]MBL1206885.1 Ni/Fe-hydrogenase cytochrome b subunit [Calditrichota bacterium]NOG46711.1 Ni/Fe-hydrogenase cytochrome b subunit [Calditrichota bacterium]